MTTGKTIALTIQTFVSKVVSAFVLNFYFSFNQRVITQQYCDGL